MSVPASPHSPSSHLSSKSPNLNPFSPLSPDLGVNAMSQSDQETNQILGLEPLQRPVQFYSRQKLLQLAQVNQHASPPEGMGSLDTWYGPPVKLSNTQYLEDPAIASISPPPSSTTRRGGYGEGFGFGGGIGGGRGLAKGGRNIGLRRQPDTLDVNGLPVEHKVSSSSYGGGQMGRFSVRNPGSTRSAPDEPKKDKRRDDEWRRPERAQPRDSRRPTWQTREDDTVEPAWMDDGAGPSSDITIPTESEDPLIKFIPGEDMIAAHKRAMKAREAGAAPRDWRNDTAIPTASFFASDPAIASSSSSSAPVKPKTFNAANYLTQAKVISEDEEGQQPHQSNHQVPVAAFSSRFQRLFTPTAEQPTESAASAPEEPRDDRMARLMGLLSTKSTPPADQNLRHLSSPPIEAYPPPRPFSEGPPPSTNPSVSHPNILLQQLYGGGGPREIPISNHDQRFQAVPRPAQHFSTPPSQQQMSPMFGRDTNHPSQGYQPFIRPPPSGFPAMGPPGFLPSPSNFGPPQQPIPLPAHHPYGGGLPPQHIHVPQQQQQLQQQQPYQPHLGTAQEDMLATLFAGLGPRG